MKAKLIQHKNQSRIALYFDKESPWQQNIKQFANARWSITLKAWHVQDTEENRFKLRIEEKKPEFVHSEKVKLFREWMRSRRYSEQTVDTYADALRVFLEFFPDKAIAQITHSDVIRFNNEYILKRRLSSSYQNQVVNAVKLFFRTVEHTIMEVDSIHRPKKEKTLPNVLSKEEVKMILEAP
jgi:integrase/recombinase XerD